MQIQTTRFGLLELPDEEVIRFPQGLYGLPGNRYCLIRHDAAGPFFWLQSVDSPKTAMVVADPFLFFPSYEVDIPTPAAEALRAETAGDVEIYTTITVAQDGSGITANLLGPVVVGRRAGLGMQLIQDAQRYTTRHAVGLLKPVEQAA